MVPEQITFEKVYLLWQRKALSATEAYAKFTFAVNAEAGVSKVKYSSVA